MNPGTAATRELHRIHRAPWGDLVMHVLAHVRATAHLAPSLFDARYVAFVASSAGDADARALGEDARALGALATTHEALATAQLVAWLFHTKERARAAGGRALSALRDDEVDAPEILRAAVSAGDAAELLWCAALLEDDAHERLPAIAIDDAAVAKALEAMAPIAPHLAGCTIASLPSLRLRGRVVRDSIWIGAPCEMLALSVEHAVWQAAHEATVREVSLAHGPLDHDTLEETAIAVLAQRANDAGARSRHAVWLAHFDRAPRSPT